MMQHPVIIDNMTTSACIFKFKYDCSSHDKLSDSRAKIPGEHSRIDSVITASEHYGDHLSGLLKTELSNDPPYTFYYHQKYISRYAIPRAYSKRK